MRASMRRVDLGVAAGALALAGLVATGTASLPFWADYAPGPSFVPVGVAVAGAVLALLLGAEAVRRAEAIPEEEEAVADLPDRDGIRRVVLTFGCLLLFAILAVPLGFVGSAGLFMLAVLVPVLRQRVLPSLLATALTVGLIWGVFVFWLGIALPKGALGL